MLKDFGSLKFHHVGSGKARLSIFLSVRNKNSIPREIRNKDNKRIRLHHPHI
ncbi:hypothetical protein IC582_029356 [Cucumis melo]